MYHFIVNPNASSGKGRKAWSEAEQILKAEGVSYTVHFPEDPEESEALVRSLTSTEGPEECHLVVVGGDGTLNTVLQGINRFDTTKLSLLRMGSANDFAEDMKLSGDISEALRHLLREPEEITLDYGVMTCRRLRRQEETIERRFLISSGIGFDADICAGILRSPLKNILNRLSLGRMTYLLEGLRLLFFRKSTRASILIEGEEPLYVDRLFMAVGMIHRFEGGGVPFCPDADPRDGLLDICLVEKMPKWKLLLAVLLVYRRKHTMLKGVKLCRGRKVTVITERSQWFHMDGETSFRVRKLDLECRSGLRFIY